ncbi:MAG: carbohydrate binding family 9 domain-containing protein [Candidatus Marinimicrobia bacterium]|nr:carbohydrate binding family 9 domain-containing protein [Candidatus Neomarinimicrobiota bacterium]
MKFFQPPSRPRPRLALIGLLAVLGILTLPVPMRGQIDSIMPLTRVSGPIVIDGVITAEEWAGVEPLPLVESYPNFGAAPSEVTEIRVAYDSEYFYASARFFSDDMSKVIASALERDVPSPSDEGFGIVLDTFNDNENALSFWVNAAGNRTDLSISRDAEAPNGTPWNRSWNTFWDAATVRDDKGWYAELRIPFSSLRFQDKDGQVVMGLIAWRYLAQKNEFVSFPPYDPQWSWGFVKPSIAQDVSFENVFASRPLYITPYFLGGNVETVKLNDVETGYLHASSPQRNFGADLKVGLTSNLTLDLTLKTDFAQVEADEVQVNLTRFTLFFPEKRLFFQERASIFEFSNGGPNRLFHSRRIGLSDYGQVPILAGGRLVGRIGGWDIGLLNMQTQKIELADDDDKDVLIPAENFTVARIRRQVLNKYSYMGAMLTYRLNENGDYNRAQGLDGIFRLWGDDYLSAAWSQSFRTGQASGLSALDIGRLRLNLRRRGITGFLYSASYSLSGSDYDPAMGFNSRTDFVRIANELGYGWLGRENSRIYTVKPAFSTVIFYGATSGKIESSEIGPRLNFSTTSGHNFGFRATAITEVLADTLWLPEDTYVDTGSYRFADFSATYQMPISSLLRAGVNFSVGPFYDGFQVTVGIDPSWTISERYKVSGNYQVTRATFPDSDAEFTVHLLRARLNANFDAQLSTRLFLQINTATQQLAANFRVRYNPTEGTDLYFVLNQNFFADRNLDPQPPLSSGRTVLLKYSITFLR